MQAWERGPTKVGQAEVPCRLLRYLVFPKTQVKTINSKGKEKEVFFHEMFPIDVSCIMWGGVSERFAQCSFSNPGFGPAWCTCIRKAMLSTFVPLTSGLALHLLFTCLLGGGHEGREHSRGLNCLGLWDKAFRAICPFPAVAPLTASAQDEGGGGSWFTRRRMF